MKSGLVCTASRFLWLVAAIALFADTRGAIGQATAADDTGCFASSQAVSDTLGPKNRFLSFSGGDTDRLQAIRVTFVALPPPFNVWNGSKLWVTQPSLVSENGACVSTKALFCQGWPTFQAGTLQCEPFYRDWNIGTVHVFHEGIIPEGSYRIQVIDSTCSVDDESSFSDPVELTAAKWSDTVRDCAAFPCPPPDGVVNIVDALAVIGRFGTKPDSIIKARADLEPGCLDLQINITDVLFALGGFQGFSYPFEPSATDPCDSLCSNPLP